MHAHAQTGHRGPPLDDRHKAACLRVLQGMANVERAGMEDHATGGDRPLAVGIVDGHVEVEPAAQVVGQQFRPQPQVDAVGIDRLRPERLDDDIALRYLLQDFWTRQIHTFLLWVKHTDSWFARWTALASCCRRSAISRAMSVIRTHSLSPRY